MEVSIVMPCLNEAETIASCIKKASAVLKDNNLEGEIIVADNGSTDNSVEIAKKMGARVVFEKTKGYGCVYQKGVSEAKGKYIIIGDSDDTYDFSSIMDFVLPLKSGYEFVNGSRMKGQIHKGAMPFMHKYFGNPLLSFILSIFFGSKISDGYCGMKAFTKETYEKIKPVSPGMEFALELVINAIRSNLKMTEIAVDLHPRKKGVSKLRTFKDGWRSLRFMLLYCPNYLFIIPGTTLFSAGFTGLVLLLNGPVTFLNHVFDFHAMIFSGILTLLGFQVINLGLFAKSYALAEGFEKENTLFFDFYKIFNLEKGVLAGSFLIIVGVLMGMLIIKRWFFFGSMEQGRQELFALILIVIGVQTIFSSFLISVIGIKRDQRKL